MPSKNAVTEEVNGRIKAGGEQRCRATSPHSPTRKAVHLLSRLEADLQPHDLTLTLQPDLQHTSNRAIY